jgi:peptidoglycan/xylan/chitin deacetylase (PgdA/CDA1 family)
MSVLSRAAPLVAAAAYGAYATPALALVRCGRGVFSPVTRVPAGVAITFDDGPDARSTPRVLDALDKLDAKATFFLVGEQVWRARGLAHEIVLRGHEVACHGYHHRNHLARTPRDVQQDLVRAGSLIEDVCGTGVAWFRPPYGVFNAWSWRTAADLGWDRVLWSRWARDWEERATADSIAGRATDGLQDGEILLLHDADTYSAPNSYAAMLDALPRIVEHVDALGLRTVRLGDALVGG